MAALSGFSSEARSSQADSRLPAYQEELMVLERVSSPDDLKILNAEDLGILAPGAQGLDHTDGFRQRRPPCIKPRHYRADHRASLCLSFPLDKIIWDVGHQSYAHKVLTAERSAFLPSGHITAYRDSPRLRNPFTIPSGQVTAQHPFLLHWGFLRRG